MSTKDVMDNEMRLIDNAQTVFVEHLGDFLIMKDSEHEKFTEYGSVRRTVKIGM